MPRSTVYNDNLVTPEKWERVNEQNKELLNDFIQYCRASDKSEKTCKQYESQLKIIMVWLSEKDNNKFFVDVKKRDWVKFTAWLSEDLGVSSNRISSLKSVISSLSNYIENVLDDEYPTFRNISKVIDPGAKHNVRDKNIVNAEEVNACLEELVKQGKYQIACCLSLMFNSGCRISEVVQIRVDDFDDKNLRFNGMAIQTHVMRTKGRGKLGKQISRYVFMKDFRKYLDLWLAEREKNGVKTDELFVVYSDGKYRPAIDTTIRGWFTNKISKVMGKDVNPHCLRHAWVTERKREGYPDSVLKTIIKWESIDMVSLYNDMDDSEELEGFFANLDENGKPIVKDLKGDFFNG